MKKVGLERLWGTQDAKVDGAVAASSDDKVEEFEL
jgi:hypothetical protein